MHYGFRRSISREEFANRIKENTLTEVLNAVPVKKGDAFFIPSGTLHAICKGIVIAEIQQNSNVTQRVYDYGRLGADGKPRALHINQAWLIADMNPPRPQNFGGHLGQCRYFTTDLLQGEECGLADASSFVSLLVTKGNGVLACGGEEIAIQKGDGLFLPAGSGSYTLRGNVAYCAQRCKKDCGTERTEEK